MKIFIKNFVPLLIITTCFCSCKAQQRASVILPIADIKATPEKTSPSMLPVKFKNHQNQESQVLFGEQVIVAPSKHAGWSAILAPEQPIKINLTDLQTLQLISQKFGYNITTERWFACPGLLETHQTSPALMNPSHTSLLVTKEYWSNIFKAPQESATQFEQPISIGSKLHGKRINETWWEVSMPENTAGYIKNDLVYEIQPQVEPDINALRMSFVTTSRKFIGSYYIWGGRSSAMSGNQKLDNQITGVDCSGLVHVCLAAHGLTCPRNSHDQYLASAPIQSGRELQPGDLMFFYNPQRAREGKSFRITHVMIYSGNGLLIEATAGTSTFDGVLEHSVEGKIGQPVENLINGQKYLINNLEDGQVKQVEYQLFMGSFFNAPEKLHRMRNLALNPEIIINDPTFNF